MNIYPADAAVFQPSRQSGRATILAWIKRGLAARARRRLAAQEARYLRTLPSHALDDIGLDVARLADAYPSLAAFNPEIGGIDVLNIASR